MAKVMIEVDDNALELVDRVCHYWYYMRVWLRNEGGYDFIDDSGMDYKTMCYQIEYFIKPLAKKFGVYPYNQEIVGNP